MSLEREDLRATINEIKATVSKKSASRKDEVSIMKAMLNDPEYKVGVYTKEGQVDTYCPYEDSRKMLTNVIATTTKMSTAEAGGLANEYSFTKSDASTMVNVGKEFVNSYMEIGRKLPLGGRETSNVSLVSKHVDARVRNHPTQSGEIVQTQTPAFDTIRVLGTCPDWVKNK